MVRSCFIIEVAPPFRLDLTVWALRRRALNQIDRWDGTCWRRTLFAGDAPVALSVTQIGSVNAPRLRVDIAGGGTGVSHRLIHQALDRVLGLGIDLAPFHRFAAGDARLSALAMRFRGMRPPRFPTIFEALMNGIACQQLSLEAGLSLLNRLAATYGQASASAPDAGRAFPRPCDLGGASVQSLRALGFSSAKSVAIIDAASGEVGKGGGLEAFGGLDDAGLFAKLDALRGVGRWTAEYVLLRGYGRLGVFPGDDVGARNGLQRWLGLRRSLDYEGTEKVVRRWRPYGGLVYLHLLLKSLEERGHLGGVRV